MGTKTYLASRTKHVATIPTNKPHGYHGVQRLLPLLPDVHRFYRMLDTLDTAASVWTDVKSQAPTTQQNLIPLTKLWSHRTEEEMEAYQAVVAGQARTTLYIPFIRTNARTTFDHYRGINVLVGKTKQPSRWLKSSYDVAVLQSKHIGMRTCN